MVSLWPLHGLPGGARVEGDESGQVGRPEGLLSHPLSKLASQVNPSQARHSVEISKICLNLDTTTIMFVPKAGLRDDGVIVGVQVRVGTFIIMNKNSQALFSKISSIHSCFGRFMTLSRFSCIFSNQDDRQVVFFA